MVFTSYQAVNTNANGAVAGDTDFNNLNNVGATFMFIHR
jgi:hypothetical protein